MQKRRKGRVVGLALGLVTLSAAFGGLAWASARGADSKTVHTSRSPARRLAVVPIPGVARFLAAQENVGQLRSRVRSSDGSATVVSGLSGTTPVTTVVIDGGAAPFVPEGRLFAASPLAVQSGMGGSTLSSVGSFVVAGVVAPNIEKVVLEYQEGGRIAAALVEGAFAESLSPAKGGVTVIAYAHDGSIAASRYILAPSAPAP